MQRTQRASAPRNARISSLPSKGIYLALASERPEAVDRDVRAGNGESGIRWIFLGRDYAALRRWEEGLGSGYEKVQYSELLQSIGLTIRQRFLDWIGDLGKREASLGWWTSYVAERNTMGESLFHLICYTKVGIEQTLTGDTPLLIVAESAAVLDLIAAHEKSQSRIRRRSSGSTSAGTVWLARFCVRWARYFAESVRALADAQSTRATRATAPSRDGRRVLMRSCMDDSYFSRPDGAGERYMPGLAGMLEAAGYEVEILPWLCNVTKPRAEVFRWLRGQSRRYLIPEDHYRFTDYLWAARIVMSQLRLPRGVGSFDGMDVGGLVGEERRRQAADPSRAQFVMYYRLVERLSAAGEKFDVFIDMFENLASEKPSVMGFRRWMPDTLTVGYQHYLSMYPLLLSLFTSRAEADNAPHPDVIVAGSDLGAEQLAFAGFPRGKIRTGPTLRYQSLLEPMARSSTGPRSLLVVIPQEVLAAEELLSKVIEAFADPVSVPVAVRMHPMLSEGALDPFFKRHPMPSHFTIAGGPMSDWLASSACVVTMAGSTAFEVALKAIPVVVVGRETDFNFDALGWYSEFPAPVTSSSALRQRVLEQISLSSAGKANLEAWATKMLPRAVTPLRARDVSVFVERDRSRASH